MRQIYQNHCLIDMEYVKWRWKVICSSLEEERVSIRSTGGLIHEEGSGLSEIPKKTKLLCFRNPSLHVHLPFQTPFPSALLAEEFSHLLAVVKISLCARVLSRFSHVSLFATPWTLACQAPLSMGFSRQEYWSGLPFPSPGVLPNPRIELRSPALQAESLMIELQYFILFMLL